MLSNPHRASDFPSTERYELRRRLGSGSCGVVYEGWDRERKAPVALKWLSHVDAETIHRFKTEFRSLAEISHPNLVQLYDLACDGDRWFLTMELVEGVTLPEHLRPNTSAAPVPRAAEAAPGARNASAGARSSDGRPPLDVSVDEVRAVFSELARGVHALHEAGKLHRDLKCQNVMVTPAKRVVLLDFGLVREVEATHVAREADIAGTPLYMAPEQCAGVPIDRAADWYAVGVMLFRALANRFPFEGRLHDVMREKQLREAPSVSALVAGVPSDLDELCARLLARRPADRPAAREILAILGAGGGPTVAFPPRAAEVFVGRRRELAMLEDARSALRSTGPTAIYVHGASGIGKTALVRRFLDEVRARAPETLVLEGRCFERERLPHKALDRVIDSLVAELRQMPAELVDGLVPEHAPDLVRVFPALARVPSFRAAASSDAPVEPQEQRRRAIEGFGDLFRRLARTRDVVVFVDDLQWGDRDSATLVAPLLDAPDVPVLWLGTFRTDEARSSPYLEYLGLVGIDLARTSRTRTTLVELAELDCTEARALVEVYLAGTQHDDALVEKLVREAAGNPLFIDLLARRAQSSAAEQDLSALVEDRVQGLPPEAPRLLRALAVRGRPLERAIAAEVVGVPALDVTMLTHLRNGRLIRIRGSGESEELELYHDRIRETVAAQLSPPEERALHARLAAVLELRGADPEALAYHHRGAGQSEQAYRFTVEAARRAEKALAFERAAERYRSAIELGARLASAGEIAALREAEAHALRNAGRGAEAAQVYLVAAAASPREKALELRRLAGEQYLLSGHLDAGRAVLRTVLRDFGISFPEHPARALAEFVFWRAQVRVRGFGYKERRADEIDESELRRIDTCWAVSVGLAMIDPVRGGVFQARHLLAALDAGEPMRLARAVAVEIPFSGTSGMSNRRRTAELERIGRELAERAGDDYTAGLLAETTGGAAWLEGRWSDALSHLEHGIAIHRRTGGAAWEMTAGTIVLLDVLWRMGRWRELFERYPGVLADAVSRGDLLLETYTRVKFRSLSRLAAGEPDEAIREASDAVARWSQASFTLLQLWEVFSHVEAQLYAGRAEAARKRLVASWPSVVRAQLFRVQIYDITMHELAGRVALACAAEASGRTRAARLADAEAAARHLERGRAPWALGPAAALRAGLAAARGERRRALAWLRRAEQRFEESAMEVHAQAVRARAAELTGEASDVHANFAAIGLARPDRWIALLVPGPWSAA